MERLACRGGRYISGANAGFFALLVRTTRVMYAPSLGFRPAFALNVRSLKVMAVRPERGKRGPFPPQAKGKQQQLHAAGRQRKRRGAFFHALAPVPIGNGPKAERLALRGGRYGYAANDGLFALLLNIKRSHRFRNVGFRPALALCCRSLTTMVMRTEQG